MNLLQLNQRKPTKRREINPNYELESRNGHCFKITRNHEKWWLNLKWHVTTMEGKKT